MALNIVFFIMGVENAPRMMHEHLQYKIASARFKHNYMRLHGRPTWTNTCLILPAIQSK